MALSEASPQSARGWVPPHHALLTSGGSPWTANGEARERGHRGLIAALVALAVARRKCPREQARVEPLEGGARGLRADVGLARRSRWRCRATRTAVDAPLSVADERRRPVSPDPDTHGVMTPGDALPGARDGPRIQIRSDAALSTLPRTWRNPQ